MPFCTACGSQNPDDARFCSQCGTRLVSVPSGPTEAPAAESTATISLGPTPASDTADRQLSAVDAAAVDALPPGHALLVVQRGPGAGSRFLLDADLVTAGRHPDSEIFLDDVTVSRRACRISPGGFGVHGPATSGSLNGTYVNRTLIDESLLAGGDEVQIGKYRVVLFLVGGQR